MRTHFKPTETFQYTFFTMCHPPGAKKGFVKGEALRLLRTNSSRNHLKKHLKHLMQRRYPQNFINKTFSEVKFQERTQLSSNETKQTKQNKNHKKTMILPFRNTIPSSRSKSERNPNKEVMLNTATTIAKPNF